MTEGEKEKMNAANKRLAEFLTRELRQLAIKEMEYKDCIRALCVADTTHILVGWLGRDCIKGKEDEVMNKIREAFSKGYQERRSKDALLEVIKF